MRTALRVSLLVVCVLTLLCGQAAAQAPTGAIAGTVLDATGAVVPGAKVTITHRATNLTRTIDSATNGSYSVPALAAGNYEVKVEMRGFQTRQRMVTVVTGSTTTVDFQLQIGSAVEVVQVEDAAPQIQAESHKIDGVISRQQIQNLPLNGRNFLQLAFLEPGVSVGTSSLAQYNAQFNVSILGGSSSRTALTVDGGNIRNSIEGGSQQNFSQEVVQEFQISTTNFDLSTGITSVGAVNIVTRSGGNDFHGSGYFFFRDHNMSAYPYLRRNAFNPDPFFARRQSGFWVGGPIKKDRAFFFFNLEHMNQDNALAIEPDSPYFAGLRQVATNPYTGTPISVRFDVNLTPSHNLFLRYSHDGNNGFGPRGGGSGTLPSNWLKNTNWSDTSVLGLGSSLTPRLINDLRFTYGYWQNRNLFPTEQDCPGCIGLGLPQMSVIGTNVQFGNTSNATQGRDLRRFHLTDTLSMQRTTHRIRFGADMEWAPGTGFWGFADPAAGAVWGPDLLKAVLPAPVFASFNLPSSFTTTADLLKLPYIISSMGIGDPSQPPPYNIDKAKKNNRYRFFFQDSWHVKPNFTLNYGLAYQLETTLVNHDLTKPAFLAPFLGSDLEATRRDNNNFSPAVGFAWSLTKDHKTVLRAGAGIYYDTQNLWERLEERAYIGPPGNGRTLISSAAVPSPIAVSSPIPGFGVAVGTPLDFQRQPTAFTLGHFMQIVGPVRSGLEQFLRGAYPQDLSIRGINVAKQATHLVPTDYPVSYSEHFHIGLQRELASNLALTTDFVFRQFMKQNTDGIDWNHFNSVGGPVIPRCTGSQAANPLAQCSTGSIGFWTPAMRSNYKGLLVKLDKRYSRKYQFTASYALQERYGVNGFTDIVNNWFATWGPQGSRHSMTLSGFIDLPWDFQLSLISSMSSKGALMPNIPSIDLEGDGTNGQPIPGAKHNGFNRGLGKDDLSRLVQEFNSTYAGKKTSRGQTIPTLTLPSSYEFGDNFFSQDIRLTKNFSFKERYRISLIGEVFNLFNIANLGGHTFNLTSPAFGRPTERAGQTFGSGGPRAVQFALRFTF